MPRIWGYYESVKIRSIGRSGVGFRGGSWGRRWRKGVGESCVGVGKGRSTRERDRWGDTEG